MFTINSCNDIYSIQSWNTSHMPNPINVLSQTAPIMRRGGGGGERDYPWELLTGFSVGSHFTHKRRDKFCVENRPNT